MCFQQNGGTAHTAQATTDILRAAFLGRLISHFGSLHEPVLDDQCRCSVSAVINYTFKRLPKIGEDYYYRSCLDHVLPV